MPLFRWPLTLLIALAGTVACADRVTGNTPPLPTDTTLTLRTISTSLSVPVYLTAPPGDTARLFVVEKGGRIRIIDHGSLLPAPFLDLSAQVSNGAEQGLLGMAFYPDYATSGRFIVDYTSPQGSTAGGTSVISRFHVSAEPNVASPTEEVLLTVPQPYENHNGGMVTFGPDGYLYIGLGDGGSGGDPEGHGQNLTDLLGSLLRIDVSGSGSTGGAYAIPPDNPWATSATNAHELWNFGLRNPWRFSFDRETRDLYIADVGQNAREEIDIAPAGGGGQNYGWNLMEGTVCYGNPCDITGLTPPVLDYGHGDGCSVTGGYVYRGEALPAMRGVYFYSDYCSGWVRSFRWRDGQITDQLQWPGLASGGNVTSFGEDALGEVYVLTASGGVYRIVAR
jgi:glucose/arabinose dehydrogenase